MSRRAKQLIPIERYYQIILFLLLFADILVFVLGLLNPLSANVGYIRHDTVVTSDSCNSGHSENYEKIRVRA